MEFELQCPVCEEMFTDPVTLECSHHLCAVHMANCSPGSRFQCPVCGEQNAIPEGGVRVDHVLKIVVEAYKLQEGKVPPPTCGHCEEKLASKRCLQCNGFLCEDCEQATHSRGYFRSHQMVDFRAESAGDLSSRMTCSEHSKSLAYYCLECRSPVCSHCSILGEHQFHQKTPVDKAYQTGKETLQAWVQRLSQRISLTEALLESFRQADEEITRKGEVQRAVVNNEMDHLRELIETKRRQLLQKSALEEKQKRVQLQAQVDRAEGHRSEASRLVGRSEVLLSLGSEHAFLAVVLPLIQDMKACAGTAVDDNQRVSTAFRPLSTDAQVRVLGDLDLGHRLQPVPVVNAGQVNQMEPSPFAAAQSGPPQSSPPFAFTPLPGLGLAQAQAQAVPLVCRASVPA